MSTDERDQPETNPETISTVALVVWRRQKRAWIQAARRRNLKLRYWIEETLDAAANREKP